ncbi:MAG: ABC transporter ATP-binding protein [Candidatus Latescibacteria bacterium]|jgi:ABC-2 type transport system ATP-binding protein|nr:ABC transporter ATP-binding protein [Candidatus Latescibacterota bacterium]
MIIKIKNLTKTYPKSPRASLDKVSFEIPHGTFGLLGPNGAGKTTLIKILSTQMEASSGLVLMDELSLQTHRTEIRKRLGYLPQHFGTYPKLSAWEFLDYMALLAGIHKKKQRQNRVEIALNDVGLFDARNRESGTFSGGMMRRLGIAQAILGDPEFLIVDEPTVGLDPEERIRFRGILARLGRDRAILISTHIVGDISSICEDVAVLCLGELVFRGSPADLIEKAEGKTWEVEADDSQFEGLTKQFRVVTVNIEGGFMRVRMVGDGSPPLNAVSVAPNLEDAYVYFMDDDEAEQSQTTISDKVVRT